MINSFAEILFQDCELSSISSFYHRTENENKILKLQVKTYVMISKNYKKASLVLAKIKILLKKLLQSFKEK